jgi:1-acyl-sn-glycerol-3-phosphate acyltransferase
MPAAAEVSTAFRRVMTAVSPIVRRWGRLEVTGLEHMPASGPVLLAGNHDSWWDTVTIGTAALEKRQIRALAKSSLWKYKPVGKVLDGMGQIPILRGAGDAGALDRAIEELRAGACIGIFPEGTRSKGRELRARRGFGRIAQAVPEAEIVLCTVVGTTDVVRFPTRPQLRVRFFRPAGGGLQPGEELADFTQRLLDEIRAEAPRTGHGRRPHRHPKETP